MTLICTNSITVERESQIWEEAICSLSARLLSLTSKVSRGPQNTSQDLIYSRHTVHPQTSRPDDDSPVCLSLETQSNIQMDNWKQLAWNNIFLKPFFFVLFHYTWLRAYSHGSSSVKLCLDTAVLWAKCKCQHANTLTMTVLTCWSLTSIMFTIFIILCYHANILIDN